jgi:cyclopropane-fatty-acyl-phospholipid synthase
MLANRRIRFSTETPTESAVAVSINFLEHLLATCPRRDFRVRFWDGTIWGGHNYRYTLVLKHPGALRKMFTSPNELTLGEAYIFGDFDIEGDIESAFDLADFLLSQDRAMTQRLYLSMILGKLPTTGRPKPVPRPLHLRGAAHTVLRDQDAIRYHYDLPPEFYSLFLDSRMLYSCAYFQTAEDGLDQAQEQKLDYICRKLGLHPGERLLDIGCGWGALVIHAAARYGAHALGITLSEAQAKMARKRIRDSGIEDRCSVEVLDYRELPVEEQFDKIVSVGMFEHVGEEHLSEYFSRTRKLLGRGGVFLNSGISLSASYHRHGPSFIDRYVFPDGELIPLNASLRAAEISGYEVRDVESLREHYALTLHHWVRRLEANAEQVRRVTGDLIYRTWRLYMAGSAHKLRSGSMNLYHILLTKPLNGKGSIPLTRDGWYGRQKVGQSSDQEISCASYSKDETGPAKTMSPAADINIEERSAPQDL